MLKWKKGAVEARNTIDEVYGQNSITARAGLRDLEEETLTEE